MTMKMPTDSVRGRIRAYIEKHAHLLGTNVLEVGSRIHDPNAWWLVNRDLAKGKWTGIDMQPGLGVDYVIDIESNRSLTGILPLSPPQGFSGILCSEVLEHVKRPWLALGNLYHVLIPGGWIIITVPFGFHRHAYPNDYYRYTDQGLKVLLDDAGFVDYSFEYAGNTVLSLKNHSEQVFKKNLETQLFAIARKPI
jgi:predicted SAM-dependent methyltransferase